MFRLDLLIPGELNRARIGGLDVGRKRTVVAVSGIAEVAVTAAAVSAEEGVGSAKGLVGFLRYLLGGN